MTNSGRSVSRFGRIAARIEHEARLGFDYPEITLEKLTRDVQRHLGRYRKLADATQSVRRAIERHRQQLVVLEKSKNASLEELKPVAENLLSEVRCMRDELETLLRQTSRLRHNLNGVKLSLAILDDAPLPGLATLIKKTQDLETLINQLSVAKTALREEVKNFVDLATWNQKVLEPKAQIAAGFTDVGVRALFALAYGTEAPRVTRKAALTELVRWAKSIQRIALSQLFGYHLEFSKTKRTLERAADLNLVAYEAQRKSSGQFEKGEDYFILLEAIRLDAGEQQADNLLWAANFVAKLERTVFGEDVTHEVQLQWINASLAASGLTALDLQPGAAPALDRISAEPGETKVKNQALVTVIMPAFNSEAWIASAIKGLLGQTWANLEIIVVDDCSTDATVSIAKSFEALDNRVRVLKADTNSGPYHCRNIALRVAQGDFITVHDADDWSHPQKIELQVSHLISNADAVANVSEGARLDESDLITGVAGRSQILRPNFSSLLFRRQQVLEKLGFWDEVRFGGDSEFQHRLESCFGEDSLVQLRTGLVSLLRVLEGSLTAGGLQENLSGARRIYKNSFTKWHDYLVETDSSYYIDPAATRRFYAPHASIGKSISDETFDVVLVSDFSGSAQDNASRLELVMQALKAKLRVGLSHVPSIADLKSTPSVEVEAFALQNEIALLWHLASERESDEPIQADHLIATDGASAFRYDKVVSVDAKEFKLLLENPENSGAKQLAMLTRNFKAMFGEEPSIVEIGESALTELNDIAWLAEISKR